MPRYPPKPRGQRLMPRRLHQRVGDAARTPPADHLGAAFLVGRAIHGAIRAGLAGAIGAAAVELLPVRERAAGLVAGRLELIGGGFRQREVAGERGSAGRKAERKCAGENDEVGDGSHDEKLQRFASPRGSVAETAREGTLIATS